MNNIDNITTDPTKEKFKHEVHKYFNVEMNERGEFHKLCSIISQKWKMPQLINSYETLTARNPERFEDQYKVRAIFTGSRAEFAKVSDMIPEIEWFDYKPNTRLKTQEYRVSK